MSLQTKNPAASKTDRLRFREAEPIEGRSGTQWLALLGTAVRLRDRLRLLVDFGLTDRDIAKATPGAAPRSIRRWRTEGPPSTKVSERWEPVDDLCSIIGLFLADGSYDRESIVAWLRSRHPVLDSRRPLEVLGDGDFSAVLLAAERTLSLGGVAEDDSIFATHPGRQLDPMGSEQRRRRSVRTRAEQGAEHGELVER
jgi:hypothetical protein